MSLPDPTVSRFDACKVITAADIQSLSLLAHSYLDDDSFGMGCGIAAASVYLSIRVALEQELDPSSHTTQTVGGHMLASPTQQPVGECEYLSQQGEAIGARYEFLEAHAYAVNSTLPAGACSTAQQALVRYLDTTGLR